MGLQPHPSGYSWKDVDLILKELKKFPESARDAQVYFHPFFLNPRTCWLAQGRKEVMFPAPPCQSLMRCRLLWPFIKSDLQQGDVCPIMTWPSVPIAPSSSGFKANFLLSLLAGPGENNSDKQTPELRNETEGALLLLRLSLELRMPPQSPF